MRNPKFQPVAPRVAQLPSLKHTHAVTTRTRTHTRVVHGGCAGKVLLNEPLEYRLPRFELIDLATVDVVLISNFQSILALPYIMESEEFKGVVYATEPTLQFGQQLMNTMVAHSSRSYRQPSTVRTVHRFVTLDVVWQQLFIVV